MGATTKKATTAKKTTVTATEKLTGFFVGFEGWGGMEDLTFYSKTEQATAEKAVAQFIDEIKNGYSSSYRAEDGLAEGLPIFVYPALEIEFIRDEPPPVVYYRKK